MSRNWYAACLLLVGCTQMLADVCDWPRVRALAATTQVAPAMKVFTAHRGFETFANRFFVAGADADGRWDEVEIDPARYAGLRGPYNRRNAYGAAFAYGPLLRSDERTRGMHASVLVHALCAPGLAAAELGLGAHQRWRIRVQPRAEVAARLPLVQTLDCASREVVDE